MWRITLSVLIVLCVEGAVASERAQGTAEKNRLTVAQAISVREIQDPRTSPDGRRLAFTVVDAPVAAEQQSHIWTYSPESRALRKFTESSKSESQPRWSPDGRRLAFLSDRDGLRQIYVMPVDGGEASKLTSDKRTIEDFAWSPDSREIAFIGPEPVTADDERKQQEKNDARSVDRDAKRAHLWLVNVDSGAIRSLVGAPWRFTELQWSAHPSTLIVVATDHPESDRETNRIFSVTPDAGTIREIAAPSGPFRQVRVSPDGGQISYIGTRRDGPSPHDLYVMRVGMAARNLTAANIDRLVTSYEWRSERELVALVDDGFRSKLYTVDLDGHASLRVTPDMKVSGFGSFNATSAILIAERMSKPPELWQWEGRPALSCVSDFNAHFDAFELQQPEMIRYRSFDGTQIEAALLRPLGVQADTKAPAVILVHGGPASAWSDSFDRVSRWGQLLSQAGYAVLLPNIRGSTGYGHEFIESNRGDWGGRDFKDVLAGADYLTSHGLADPQRLGIAGWSYGGYMAEWAITQTKRFKAAVAGAGMGDLAVEFGTEEHPAYDEWFYGLPYEKPEGFRKSSPLTYVRNARTPILILQGEADTVDPIGQSQMFYRALKRYGVVTDFVIYPREGHRIREAEHQKDVLTRVVKWFDEYLK